MNKTINNETTYTLNCSHCGEFISFDSKEATNSSNGIWIDPNLGEIKVNNLYTGVGTSACYESMDAEITCPKCSYLFKSTIRRNFTV